MGISDPHIIWFNIHILKLVFVCMLNINIRFTTICKNEIVKTNKYYLEKKRFKTKTRIFYYYY